MRNGTARVAIVSLHSHGDRSYLDDRLLAVLSAELREAGFENDLLVAHLDASDDDGSADPAFARLVTLLRDYGVVVYERVWSQAVVASLRRALPGRTFIHCRGEHHLEDPPADFVCQGHLQWALPELLRHLAGERPNPPGGTLVRGEAGWEEVGVPPPLRHREGPFVANLRPILVTPERSPAVRTFSVLGNRGCPYQSDARDNPLYDGVTGIPAELGRGCAFCVTGNEYQAEANEVTAAKVLEQIRFVRANSDYDKIVLKDQNPFGYLTELLGLAAAERLAPFTLLLETRADWFVRNQRRFERALQISSSSGFVIAPYLVGIENFSQPELDRFNKGITADVNVRFLDLLWEWRDRFGGALTLQHSAFGFIMFSPWTTMDDLRTNYDGILRTRFHELRGKLLHSRARLYPDTALYHLAQRDGLLLDQFSAQEDDNSRRYGYYPYRPWKFAHSEVAHFASLAAALVEESGGRDEMRLFQGLLEAFAEAENVGELTAHAVRTRSSAARPPDSASASQGDLDTRFRRLLAPLDVDGGFEGGWRLATLSRRVDRACASFEHPTEAPLVLELSPRSDQQHYARSRHYDVRHGDARLTAGQTRALAAVCDAIRANDR